MNFWQKLKEAADAWRAGDYLCAAKCFNDALGMIFDVIHPDHPTPLPPSPMKALAVDVSSLSDDDLLKHLEDCCQGQQMMYAGWADLLVILAPVIQELIKRLLDRLNR